MADQDEPSAHDIRALAEELLQELPDMKHEIEKELLQNNEIAIASTSKTLNTPTVVRAQQVANVTSNEPQRYRVIRKREMDETELLQQQTAAKTIKLDTATEHKSIIEIVLTNDDKKEISQDFVDRNLNDTKIIELDKFEPAEEMNIDKNRALSLEAQNKFTTAASDKMKLAEAAQGIVGAVTVASNLTERESETLEMSTPYVDQIGSPAYSISSPEVTVESNPREGEMEALDQMEEASMIQSSAAAQVTASASSTTRTTQPESAAQVMPSASTTQSILRDVHNTTPTMVDMETAIATASRIMSEVSRLVEQTYEEHPEQRPLPGPPPPMRLPISMYDDSSSSLTMDYELVNSSPEELSAQEEERDRQLRITCATFLQHVPCFKLQSDNENDSAKNVPKCRECRRRDATAPQSSNDIYCRFYEFRRLRYTLEGELLVAGFPNPFTEPTREDLNIWQPDAHTMPTSGFMDIQVCRYILLHAGDQFCYLWRQEAEALKLHENLKNSTIAWKKVVKGIREICDVCDTTLFNYHWTCDKCGFGVCLDCFKDRKEKRTCRKTRTSGKQTRGRDEYHWLLCTAATTPQQQIHELSELMLTQIIAGDSLNVLGRMLHEVRTLWQVPQVCGCALSKQELPENSELGAFILDMIKESQLKQQTSASSLATLETKRQQARMEQLHAKKMEFARATGIDYVPGRVWTKETLGKDPITHAFDDFKHINFLRKGLAGLRRFLPPRAMTLTHSTVLAPGVPHEWLCDGKLLRLTNAMHPDNRILFQEVWKCGQPVMISEVARSLNLDLWRPEAFCRDFGDKPNDLINCLNGNLVPNQPMRHFWEGFQCIQKRLLDANGKPMLLKLKDWPPGDDFAEILPTRFADLMKGLPMPEYTLRTGNLNIASCLPKMFVPPDLGPKMYNAYGSALHPDKGTTNLHLDISDAVNIMVYVGIPQDADSRSQLTATHRAIAMGGCDYLTRARSQSLNVLPGALWHIFPARDADKIRDLLNRVTLEKGYRLEPDHDPIHDQNWYLDDKLRARLFKEYGVEGYPIVQCLGDAVFIPAGAPHQVQNLHNCIKVAEDFVSPENITHCYHLTHEFRRLSNSHTNHEDKLQIKNIIYHAIKDCCTILVRALELRINHELAQQARWQSCARGFETRKTFVPHNPQNINNVGVPYNVHNVHNVGVARNTHNVSNVGVPQNVHNVSSVGVPQNVHNVSSVGVPHNVHNVGSVSVAHNVHNVGSVGVAHNVHNISSVGAAHNVHNINSVDIDRNVHNDGMAHSTHNANSVAVPCDVSNVNNVGVDNNAGEVDNVTSNVDDADNVNESDNVTQVRLDDEHNNDDVDNNADAVQSISNMTREQPPAAEE